MKNKSIFWLLKFQIIGTVNNIRNCFMYKKKIHQANLMYKNTRNIQVKTYYPENWLENSESENLRILGENLLNNKCIMQKK